MSNTIQCARGRNPSPPTPPSAPLGSHSIFTLYSAVAITLSADRTAWRSSAATLCAAEAAVDGTLCRPHPRRRRRPPQSWPLTQSGTPPPPSSRLTGVGGIVKEQVTGGHPTGLHKRRDVMQWKAASPRLRCPGARARLTWNAADRRFRCACPRPQWHRQRSHWL